MKTSTPALLTLALSACAAPTVPPTVTQDAALPALQVTDAALHVVARGPEAAPTLIVVHGGPGADHGYLRVLEPLTERYRVVWYDQRGTGASARVAWAGVDPVPALLADLDALVDRFDNGRGVHLLGHSWGAMLVSAYVGQHPGRVDGVVLAEPGFFTAAEAEVAMGEGPSLGVVLGLSGAWLRKWSIDDPEAREDWFLAQAMSSGMPEAYFCPAGPPAGIAVRRAGAGLYAATVGRAMSDEAYRAALDFRAGVDQRAREVLFMAGSCGTRIGVAHQRRLMAHFPNARLAVVEGAGHYMFNDRPRESLEVVRTYLDSFLLRGARSAETPRLGGQGS